MLAEPTSCQVGSVGGLVMAILKLSRSKALIRLGGDRNECCFTMEFSNPFDATQRTILLSENVWNDRSVFRIILAECCAASFLIFNTIGNGTRRLNVFAGHGRAGTDG